MEYLSDWPFQKTFLETPYGTLIGRELEVPSVQGAITGLPGVTVAIAVTSVPGVCFNLCIVNSSVASFCRLSVRGTVDSRVMAPTR